MKPYENIVNLSFDHEHSNSDIGDLYLNQSIKKLNTKKWRVKSSQFRHDPSPIQTTGVFSQVLDLSNYQSTKKMVGIVNKSNSDVANTKTFRQYSKVDLSNINVSQMNLNDSLTNLELNETTETDENLLVNSMVKKAFDVVYAEERCCNSMTNSKCNTQLDNKFNMTTPKETGNVTINEENKILFNDPSFTAEFVTMMENRLELDERSFCELKEGEHIYDNCIKIVRYIAEGAQAKIYVGLIEEIEKYVAIKRFNISYDEMQVNKICSECDMIKNLDHPNVVKYFDVEIIKTDPDQCRIDIIMEYIEGQNLKDFIYESNKNNKRIDMLLVKQIAQKILEGLKYLHENKIIHRDLKPENVIINEDLSEIKIADFGICTKVMEFETFKKRSLLGTPYYMAPEVILEKPYAYEADIWSVGCIVYELACGIKPYTDMNPFNAMYKMAQYTSPLEYADDNVKDLFYDKKNRVLLDFLQKCWRPNNMFRPSAEELLQHKFIIN